jgi:membrane protein DedA with SNARE-associated domain
MGLGDALIDGVADLGPVGLHLAVAGLAFGETAMFLDLVVPGEVGLVVGGAAAARSGVGLPGLVAAGALGATLGDSVSYALGRAAGAGRLPGSHWVLRHSTRSRPDAEALFARHGGRAVFLGRWVGALRAVVPFVAGFAGMRYRSFLPWNVAASVLWVGTVVCLGAAFGDDIASVVDRVGLAVSALAVIALAGVFVSRRRRAVRSRSTVGAS